jgi:hypothetical protein
VTLVTHSLDSRLRSRSGGLKPRLRLVMSLSLLGVAASLACGTGHGDRHLINLIQSVTVSPTTVDAQPYPGGRIPFVATGHYNTAPMTISPLTGNWNPYAEQIWNGGVAYVPANAAISVDASGVAQCAATASGTYAVLAWVIQDPNLRGACGSANRFGEPGCNLVQGMAQFTCP